MLQFQLKYLNVVDYHGIMLYLPRFIKYVATDADGTITGYASKPSANAERGCFTVVSMNFEDYTTSGYIPLQRIDIIEGNWMESCISVDQLLFRKTHEISA